MPKRSRAKQQRLVEQQSVRYSTESELPFSASARPLVDEGDRLHAETTPESAATQRNAGS